MDTFFIEYIFHFPDNDKNNYLIKIDKKSRILINSNLPIFNDPNWTALEFCQCANCPLIKEQTPFCPIARNLNSLVISFENKISYQEVRVEVKTSQRNYSKETNLQSALQSLFGLVMAVSGCPEMKFFSQIAIFHLPFANMEETIFRASSVYLLNQYFNKQQNIKYDFSMRGLKEIYAQVEQVNQGVIQRVRAMVKSGDANQNAIATLNSFAQMFSLQFHLDLELLSYIFK